MKKSCAPESHVDGEGERSIFDDAVAVLMGNEVSPVPVAFDAPLVERLSKLPRKDLFGLAKRIAVLNSTATIAMAGQVGKFLLSKGFRLGVQDVSADEKMVFVDAEIMPKSAISPKGYSQKKVLDALKKTKLYISHDNDPLDTSGKIIAHLKIPVEKYDAFVAGSEGGRVDSVAKGVSGKAKKVLDDETAGRG